MTGVVYQEHESGNLYRSYPFSEGTRVVDTDGVEFPTDVFSDAILYPILRESCQLYLTKVSPHYGTVEISCGSADKSEVVLTGSLSGVSDTIELYDAKGRHGGTLVCGYGWKREYESMRERVFRPMTAVFSSFVTSVIPYSGVESIVFDTASTSRKNVVFKGDGVIEPILERDDDGYILSFDASYVPNSEGGRVPIRQLIFVADGRTVFDIVKQSDDTVLLTTPQMDREDLCWQAHKEDSLVSVVDTCEDETWSSCPATRIVKKNVVVSVCPSDIGNINIVADDVLGLKNSVKTATVDGKITPNVPVITDNMSTDDILEEGAKSVSQQVEKGNGLSISMPGLTHE